MLNIGGNAILGGLGPGAVQKGAKDQGAWTRQVSENSARLAFSSSKCESEGRGLILIAEPIEFGCTFVEQPSVSYGYSLKEEPAKPPTAPVLGGGPGHVSTGDEMLKTTFPVANGIVRKWDKDDNGLYIRAYVALHVSSEGPNSGAFTIEHHFTFSGIATKTVPPDLATGASG